MNTHHTHDILTQATSMYWDYQHTGGNCWALTATHRDGGTFVLTDALLTNQINPNESVTLGYYDTPEMLATGEGQFTTYDNIADLLHDL